MRKAALLVILGLLVLLVASLLMSPNDPRLRAESGHGFRLPPSATEIQCRGDERLGFLDRGLATLFCMSTNELPAFLAQLTVCSRTAPARHLGDPTVNGFNVWPEESPTFIPGNDQYGGFKRTWQGAPTPIEMLSCMYVSEWRLVARRALAT